MSICGWWTFRQEFAGTVRLRPATCKMWACSDCAPRLKNRLRHRLKCTPVDRLVTLGCKPSLHASPFKAYRAMSDALPRLRERLERQFPALTFEYCAVWEETRAGWPHLHLLVRSGFIPQRALSRHWAELTGAPVVDVRLVSNASGAVNYLAKYLTKQATTPYGIKRYRTSHGFWDTPGGMFPHAAAGGAKWELVKTPCHLLAAQYQPVAYYLRLAPGGGWDIVPRGPPDHESPWAAGLWERRAPHPGNNGGGSALSA